MSDLVKINDLTQAYNLNNHDLFHVSQNGIDYKIDYDWLKRNIENDIGKGTAQWNASHISGVSTDTSNIEDMDVLIYDINYNSLRSRRLKYTDIDYSALSDIDSSKYLKVVGDQLIKESIIITEVKPSSANQRGKYLKVADDGLNIIESDLNLSQFMVSPGSVISNMNTVPSGISSIGDVTINKPDPAMEGYLISARANSLTTATAQILIDYNSYDTYLRTHDGVSLEQDDYGSWHTIYNSKTNPLSNSTNLDSGFNIATSKAVNSLRVDLLDYIGTAVSGSSDSLSGVIIALDTRLTNSINSLSGTVSNNNTDLGSRITGVDNRVTTLDTRVTTVNNRISTHISSGDHDARYAKKNTQEDSSVHVSGGIIYIWANNGWRQVYPPLWV